MSIAKMVREMIEKGVNPEVIELAVATAEDLLAERASADCHVTERDVTTDRRRESDRIRKQRSRDNLRMSRDNPRTSADVTNASLSKEDKKEEIKEERGAVTSRRPQTNRGSRLPDDWAPSVPDTAIADEMLGGPDRRRAEIEKFRDHWKQQAGSKGVKLDWDAAWRNWTRRAAEYGGKNGHGSSNLRTHPVAQQSGSASVFAGVAAATERRARERSAAGQQREVPRDADPPEPDDPDFFGKGGRASAH